MENIFYIRVMSLLSYERECKQQRQQNSVPYCDLFIANPFRSNFQNMLAYPKIYGCCDLNIAKIYLDFIQLGLMIQFGFFSIQSKFIFMSVFHLYSPLCISECPLLIESKNNGNRVLSLDMITITKKKKYRRL